MTTPTTNLGLNSYNMVTNGSAAFYDYVGDVSGSAATQNLGKIDSFAGNTSASLAMISASVVVLSGSMTSLSGFVGKTIGNAAQITSGSSNDVLVSASGLAHSNYGRRTAVVALNTSASLSGTEVNYVRIPAELNRWVMVDAAASVSASSTSGSPTFSVARISASSPDSAAVTIVTSGIFIKGAKYDSSTSGCTVVISTTASRVFTGDRIKVRALTSASPASNSQVSLTFQNLP